MGDVRLRWSRPLPAAPSSCSVLLDAAGRYFVSFVVDVPAAPLPPAAGEVGIDLGLARFATLDSGEVIANPRPLRQRERRLKAAQRALSRKRKGSANRERARRRVARLHARVKDARHDFLHQPSTRLLRENQAVYVEDLAVQGRLGLDGQRLAGGRGRRPSRPVPGDGAPAGAGLYLARGGFAIVDRLSDEHAPPEGREGPAPLDDRSGAGPRRPPAAALRLARWLASAAGDGAAGAPG